jgi:hypothetical protein
MKLVEALCYKKSDTVFVPDEKAGLIDLMIPAAL